MKKTCQITYEQYFEILKYLGRPEDIEKIKKQERLGTYHHMGQDSCIKIKKIKKNEIELIEICLKNPTQKIREDIKRIIEMTEEYKEISSGDKGAYDKIKKRIEREDKIKGEIGELYFLKKRKIFFIPKTNTVLEKIVSRIN